MWIFITLLVILLNGLPQPCLGCIKFALNPAHHLHRTTHHPHALVSILPSEASQRYLCYHPLSFLHVPVCHVWSSFYPTAYLQWCKRHILCTVIILRSVMTVLFLWICLLNVVTNFHACTLVRMFVYFFVRTCTRMFDCVLVSVRVYVRAYVF